MEHHEDCDGYRMHSPRVVRGDAGMWHAECMLTSCTFRSPEIGSYGRSHPETSVQHGGVDDCVGECHAWTDAPVTS